MGFWGSGIVRESRAGAHLIVGLTESLARPGGVGGGGGVREVVDTSSEKKHRRKNASCCATGRRKVQSPHVTLRS